MKKLQIVSFVILMLSVILWTAGRMLSPLPDWTVGECHRGEEKNLSPSAEGERLFPLRVPGQGLAVLVQQGHPGRPGRGGGMCQRHVAEVLAVHPAPAPPFA